MIFQAAFGALCVHGHNLDKSKAPPVTMKFRTRLFLRPEPVRPTLLLLALVVWTGNAMATLGQMLPARPPVSTASAASGAKMQAATRAVGYTMQESELESGTIVREYASLAGQVFAVSWRGPVLPDLNALLGDYFKAFREEAQRARLAGRRGSPVNMESAALVVRSNGRMRNFFGSAYAPELVPANVNIKDVLQ